MKNKIAFEEHFSIPEIVDNAKQYFSTHKWKTMRKNLLDITGRRLLEMDKSGIEKSLLSINCPAVQSILEKNEAIDFAKNANDILADEVYKNPDRFAGMAALPLQDVEAAISELKRCVNELGFKGIMVNGYTQLDNKDNALYLDLPQYKPFWAVVEELDVPFYLHPREPLASQRKIYEGHPWLLGPAWALGVETATHALRLIGSGLFDEYPKLKIVLGHLGEMLPYTIWRIDDRTSEISNDLKIKKRFGDYFRKNFYITISAFFRTPSLIDALMEMGAEHILFSTDYPFVEMTDAASWFDNLEISDNDRCKMGRENAITLFKL